MSGRGPAPSDDLPRDLPRDARTARAAGAREQGPRATETPRTRERDERPALTDLAPEEFERLAETPGLRPFHARQIRDWVWKRGARTFDEMTDLPKAAREELDGRWRVRRGEVERTLPSRDGTVGIVTRLDDGRWIESVSIPDGDRRTLCISSQVGCAVACRFCASGLDGVERNLTPGEILEQILVAREMDPERSLTNYVFMGSGEPTHNLKAVVSAIRTMNAADGLAIGARRITVSTVGHPKALAALAEVEIPFHLALSVHMPDDDTRLALMPGLGNSDLDETLHVARRRFDVTGRRLTIEVVVLAGLNDDVETARRFAARLRDCPAVVNLIPWNPVDAIDLRPPDPAAVQRVARELRAAGINTTVRRPRGRDLDLACGQLRRRARAGL